MSAPLVDVVEINGREWRVATAEDLVERLDEVERLLSQAVDSAWESPDEGWATVLDVETVKPALTEVRAMLAESR